MISNDSISNSQGGEVRSVPSPAWNLKWKRPHGIKLTILDPLPQCVEMMGKG